MATASQPLPNRIHSLDQFRGYTILGMFLVNYMGSYKTFVHPVLLHHNISCSYADTIMPHFIFAVGFAFRLSFGRKRHEGGLTAAHWRVVRRILGLMVVTFSVYHIGRVANSWDQLTQMTFWEIFETPMKRVWLQTLGHIALTSLWILPWMRTSVLTRIIVMITCALAHHLACYYGYFLYANSSPNAIDGGPLGFLTWTTPALLGTITCDWVQDAREKHKHPNLVKMFLWSIVIMLLGWMITWPARLWDISPKEMQVLKDTEYKDRDHVNHVTGEAVKPLNEKLKPFNKVVGELRTEYTNKGFEYKQALVNEKMVEAGLDPELQYPPKYLNVEVINEFETSPSPELLELRERLERYEEALTPEIIRLNDEQLKTKTDLARKVESLILAERDRKLELQNQFMVEAELDPENDKPTDAINKKVNETFQAEPGAEIVELREQVQEAKVPYLEMDSVYYDSYQTEKATLESLTADFTTQETAIKNEITNRLLTEAGLDPEADTPTEEINKKIATELAATQGEEFDTLRQSQQAQKMLTDHLETLVEIEWTKLPTGERRDLKLAIDPVIPNEKRMEKLSGMSWTDFIGRNPFDSPDEQNEEIVQYQPRYEFYWNAWMMSQRAGTMSYLIFAGGFSLFVYTLFYIFTDIWGFQIGLFRTWGTNALASYVLFELVCGAVKNFVPRDPPAWYGWSSWVIGMYLMYVVIRSLEKNKIYIRM
ncbi:hypothetical protein Pla110_24040 [Polystyrenella longa]|uniref:Heparan-alpha-glucosaminide N-acetyltransferase catalytic domain-containing protein n=1 Tax=Polystyrenella longa TaxID=2528007 RepID=A0A518CN66_9PLAN|nr:hypothetical protein [Polystyrenella longa]QDU80672.1 hypothetical protein Pla110_24040 [Polystyrenella longa]